MRLFRGGYYFLILMAVVHATISHAAITYDTIALSGDAVPGTAAGVTFNSLGIPVLNDVGQTAFNGFLAGTGVNFTNNAGVFSESGGILGLVAREGAAAPGTGAGVNFNSLGNPVINNAGQTAFLSSLKGTGVGANDEGIFSEAGSTLGLVARAGDAAPDTGEGINFIRDFGNPLLNNSGQTAFRNGLAGTGVDSTNSNAFYSEAPTSLGLVARTGDPAPGTAAGVTFSVFDSTDSPVLNGAGQTAFLSILAGTGVDSTNDRGIFSEAGGTLGLVARAGDAAPGTGADVNFNGFFNPVINNAGQTAFMCSLIGPGVDFNSNSGIFSEAGGTLGLVAREGDAAPGTAAGVVFGSFVSSFNLPAINDQGQTAFVGTLTGAGVSSTNDQGIFATDLDGTLQLIAREGDLFDINPDPGLVENRTISLLNFVGNSGGGDGRATGLNNASQLVFRLVFTDGTQGVFVASMQSELAGDLDGDGFVGINDLNIVLANWNQNVPPANPLADPSGDGFVGIDDLNTVLGNWNAGTPPGALDQTAIPEPGTLGLAVVGGLLLSAKRRKV